jgi:hypothetical protein
MKLDQAAENLQVIRTLMERSAVYRRALAPLMTFAGVLGIIAAIIGVKSRVESEASFIAYWISVAALAVTGSFLLVRRQALKSDEMLWSPPTRRVATALLPCLTAGLIVGMLFFIAHSQPVQGDPPAGMIQDRASLVILCATWAILYGCALHAAGFFASRGLRLFGWLNLCAGIVILSALPLMHRQDQPVSSWQGVHWLMGGLFGLLQLAYGIYLYVTGEEQNDL